MLKSMMRFASVSIMVVGLAACSAGSHGFFGSSADHGENMGIESHGLGTAQDFRGTSTLAVTPAHVIYFGFDRYRVAQKDSGVISEIAKHLAAHPNASVRISGNTDPVGSRAYNIALGERRATSVAKALEQQGVAKQRVTVVSYGEENPAVLGSSAMAHAKDRRADISYT